MSMVKNGRSDVDGLLLILLLTVVGVALAVTMKKNKALIKSADVVKDESAFGDNEEAN